MKTKYPTPKLHVHAELIKAWADDYKCIEIDYGSGWYSRYSPDFDDVGIKFRIKPNSNYAKTKIAELGGDDMVELYLYWVEGGEISVKHNTSLSCYPSNKDIDDLFTHFMSLLKDAKKFGTELCKKKRMVKQVLCVRIEEGLEIETKWVSNKPDFVPPGRAWHKVPSCTREVETNE